MAPSGKMEVIPQEKTFRSVPALGLLDTVSEVHGVFISRDFPPLNGNRNRLYVLELLKQSLPTQEGFS